MVKTIEESRRLEKQQQQREKEIDLANASDVTTKYTQFKDLNEATAFYQRNTAILLKKPSDFELFFEKVSEKFGECKELDRIKAQYDFLTAIRKFKL